MKLSHQRSKRWIVVVGCLWLASSVTILRGQNDAASPARPLDPSDPVQVEVNLVAAMKQDAEQDNDASVDARLRAESALFEKVAPSIVLVRRTAAVCGWLRNNNEYGRARKLASRVIPVAVKLGETSEGDRGERLYWQAWLEGEILDHKAVAIALLKEAEQLRPDDERVTDLELRLVAAVAEFGR